jgi:hypothetical protein
MTNEKKPNVGGTHSSPAKTAGDKSKPGHGNKPEANRKPGDKGRSSGKSKR